MNLRSFNIAPRAAFCFALITLLVMALGGVSLMRVELAGDPTGLVADLQSRGYQVAGSGTTLRISRPTTAPAAGPGG